MMRFYIIMASLMAISVQPSPATTNGTTVFLGTQTEAVLPHQPIKEGSVAVRSINQSDFLRWTLEDHVSGYWVLRRISSLWQSKNICQYLVYGNHTHSEPFKWEIVPYQTTSWKIARVWQQFKVLWNISFGASVRPLQNRLQESAFFANKISDSPPPVTATASSVAGATRSHDAFCQTAVIDRQRVLQGRTVNVLFNYAPIGFGGEKLHFLFVPKAHRERFSDVTVEEYMEACTLIQRVTQKLTSTRNGVQHAYLFHKTGTDAGQTVPHWHMHLIITTNPGQDWMGKLTVLKNMFWLASPLSGEELRNKVTQYRRELAGITAS